MLLTIYIYINKTCQSTWGIYILFFRKDLLQLFSHLLYSLPSNVSFYRAIFVQNHEIILRNNNGGLVLKCCLRIFYTSFIVKPPRLTVHPLWCFQFQLLVMFWVLVPLPSKHLLKVNSISVFSLFSFVNAVIRVYLVISAASPTCPTNLLFFFLSGIFDKLPWINQNFLKTSVVLYYLFTLLPKINTKFAAPRHMFFL